MRWLVHRPLVGERRAVALLMLAFFTFIFVLGALSLGGEWARCYLALAAVYGVAFFGVAAEWFWGRWFAMGIGLSGMTMALIGLVNLGWNVGLAIWGIMHLFIYAPLLGEAMADRYENREAWRQRYGIDEHGVARLKRAVGSTASALPTLILFTLAPRQGLTLLAVLAVLLAAGTLGLLRLRVWGLALLFASLVWGALASGGSMLQAMGSGEATASFLPALGLFGALMLAVGIGPFVRPAWRVLGRGS